MADKEKTGFLAMIRRPSAKYSLLSLVVVGFFSGVILWGGFNYAVEETNTMEFCISCHEMHDNVYQEYKKTIHYMNRTGVRAICSDCHVPRDWTHKMIRKVQASQEIWGKLTGSISTPEKFEAKRLELAEHEWARMKKGDSRECRNCHTFDGMDIEKQKLRGSKMHKIGIAEKKTCIDCHKGIAHKKPKGMKEDEDE
ncbi:MAG: NapC/NirT family cytochrome c [Sulfuritalea sp.]|nr:NapC/NirT family cytochrome c [Sulfuritalea sp.]